MFFFECINSNFKIYMGRDKFENEELIKYGFPEDIWFHVDNLSSAHVYLRLPPGSTINDIPIAVLNDCLQLVKENSIQGSKESKVDIIYTPWSNLKKTASMDIGQIGFHDNRLVQKQRNISRDQQILRRILRSKQEVSPDFAKEKESYMLEQRGRQRFQQEEARRKEQEDRIAQEMLQQQREYTSLMQTSNMKSNRDAADLEEDFM
eukprot:TRINITY_DN594_c1_g1_i1.p1 TRINITY_DN594_c1_g1~~TRINITY_DN594_c1_g1_i1.p1  ORF type:complete len:206 (-),score=84.44 TRINITY_DN594_c1_g1_i1:68-685(-)